MWIGLKNAQKYQINLLPYFILVLEKVCRLCGENKPISLFSANRNYCKNCRNWQHLYSINENGLDSVEYKHIPEKINGSYPEQIAKSVATQKIPYQEAKFQLQQSSWGCEVWKKVVTFLRQWK